MRRVVLESYLLSVRGVRGLAAAALDGHTRSSSAPSAPRAASPSDVAAYHSALHEWQWTQQHFGSPTGATSSSIGSIQSSHDVSNSPTADDVMIAKSNGGLVILAAACAGLFSFVQYIKGSVYEELLHRTPTVKYDDEMERMRLQRKKGGEEAAREIATKLALQGAFLQKMVAKVKRERQQLASRNPNPKNKP
jgi:hypothetical protein